MANPFHGMNQPPFSYEVIPDKTTREGIHYRIRDAADNRIATCYVRENAELIVRRMNHESIGLLTSLRKVNVARCEEVFHDLHHWTLTDWACAFGGEAGEALNKVKKLRRLDQADKTIDTPEKREQLAKEIMEELADTIIYADLLASALGYCTLEEAIKDKFNKVSREKGSKIFL